MGSVVYSLGLGVKMSVLLALPAIGVMLWQGMGRDRALRQAMLIAQVQVGFTTEYFGYILSMSNVFPDFDWIPVPRCVSTELSVSSIRVDSPILIQVDRELALRGGRDVLIEAILDRTVGRTYHSASGIPHNEMAQASQRLPSGCPPATTASPNRDQASQDCQSSYTGLHHDQHSFSNYYRMSLRQEPPLPVLRIHCLVHAISAVAKRSASSVDLRNVDSPRVGLERLSKHDRKLASRCCLSSPPYPRCMAGYGWRVNGRAGRGEAPTCGIMRPL